MFIYKSRFLTRGEVWFDEEPDGARVDWIYYRQRPSPATRSRWKPFYTVLVDLQKPPDGLLAAMEDKTARKIRDAQEQNRLQCERCDSQDARVLDKVEEMWNQFAAAQKTRPLERDMVDQTSKAGALDIVAAKDPEGNVLAYHLVFLTPKRARQLIAISPYKAAPRVAWRNAVSRANCLVHWHNFVRYSDQGIREFYFGGWYPGKTDIRLLGINRFKKSFGGRVVREYDCAQPVTLKGWLLLTAAQTITRFRQARPFAGADSENQKHAKGFEERQISPALR